MKLLVPLLIVGAIFTASCSRSGGGGYATAVAVADCSDSADGRKRIDINNASTKELSSLPGIGPVLAERIVEHRNRHGRFRRAADIIIVDGLSENKYRKIEDKICAGN